jgi:mono/diheme cytochrome c family protein
MHTGETPSGAQVYMQARCFACHGEFGFGGAGPRFRENRFVGLTDYVVGQILVGRDIMPSFADTLNDAQIAAVASFIRTSWGNKFGPVKPEQVAQIRKEIQLHPPEGPHLPADRMHQPSHVPAPPNGPKPPGQPLPPGAMK